MGWTAVTNNMDWAATAILNEYVSAINERAGTISNGGLTAVVAGDDVQAVSFWEGLQNWVLDNLIYFVDTAFEDFDGETDITMFALTTWKTESGLTSGFRRATTLPTVWASYSDAAYSYGVCQAGDIIGPWLLADLQAALNVLIWTMEWGTGHSQGYQGAYWEVGTDNALAFGWGTNPPWQDFKDAVDAEWLTAALSDYDSPMAYTRALGDSTNGYQGDIGRCASYCVWDCPEATLKRDVDFYSIAQHGGTAQDNTFGPNGDWGVGHVVGELHWWLTDAVQDGLTGISSGLFGTLPRAHPDWCDEPSSGHSKYLGYITESAHIGIVFRWNVAGGFEYVA